MNESLDAPGTADALFDAVCIGETMVSFVGTDDPRRYVAIAAGAESNVAIGMARIGCRTRWVSRTGDDPLGSLVEESLTSAGVDVAVIRDPARPTGVMVKHPSGSQKISSYYRSESAARILGPDDLERSGRAHWIHLTGITPALSGSARALVHAVASRNFPHGSRVSFDVNYRPTLWPDAGTAAAALLPLARMADLVFIGDDEAEALFGTLSTQGLADLILHDDAQVLVVKQGERGATAVMANGEVSVPALPTSPVDTTGAGDAFAAGYLAASRSGWPVHTRLQLGHFLASRVVAQIEDAVGVLTTEELEDLTPPGLASLWSTIGQSAESSGMVPASVREVEGTIIGGDVG